MVQCKRTPYFFISIKEFFFFFEKTRYLLGLALNDTEVKDWGRILLAMEMASVNRYQHLSNRSQVLAQEPHPLVNQYLKCLPIIDGNALTGINHFY